MLLEAHGRFLLLPASRRRERRAAATNIKPCRLDARLVSAVVEQIDLIDGSSRDTDCADAVPFKTPLFLRLAHLLI